MCNLCKGDFVIISTEVGFFLNFFGSIVFIINNQKRNLIHQHAVYNIVNIVYPYYSIQVMFKGINKILNSQFIHAILMSFIEWILFLLKVPPDQ